MFASVLDIVLVRVIERFIATGWEDCWCHGVRTVFDTVGLLYVYVYVYFLFGAAWGCFGRFFQSVLHYSYDSGGTKLCTVHMVRGAGMAVSVHSSSVSATFFC